MRNYQRERGVPTPRAAAPTRATAFSCSWNLSLAYQSAPRRRRPAAREALSRPGRGGGAHSARSGMERSSRSSACSASRAVARGCSSNTSAPAAHARALPKLRHGGPRPRRRAAAARARQSGLRNSAAGRWEGPCPNCSTRRASVAFCQLPRRRGVIVVVARRRGCPWWRRALSPSSSSSSAREEPRRRRPSARGRACRRRPRGPRRRSSRRCAPGP